MAANARLDVFRRLPGVEQIGVDDLEERRIQLHGLGKHFAVGQQARTEHFDLRQRSGGVENPERRVIQIAAREEPFVRFVN